MKTKTRMKTGRKNGDPVKVYQRTGDEWALTGTLSLRLSAAYRERGGAERRRGV